ncbi:hypothetical protein [Pontivivens nitratireducens]|uniref:hypothetical protein n=1 Tax=Pontivivens nitratireducens TaxID=2758038 RepID=UPI001639B3ED|nr:hypothetical protein [Pontibrevibacter nitratireducens]
MIRTLAALLIATPLAAQQIVDPESVLDLVEGRVLEYSAQGREMGREQFLSRTEVFLRSASGKCLYGEVSVRGSALCFEYEDSPTLHCWSTFRFPDGSLKMRITSLSSNTLLDLSDINDDPVICDPAGTV